MLENKRLKNVAKKNNMDTLSPPREIKFVLKFTIQVSFHISIETMNIYKMNNDNFTYVNQTHGHLKSQLSWK